MTPRGVRERLATAIGLGLALSLALVVFAPRPASAAAGSRSVRVPTIYHKSRSFRIPFNLDPADRSRLKEVQLWCSKDTGYNWDPVSVTTPDRPAFTFRSSRDGEYWFAVRTLDTKGQLYPREDEDVEPSMKVVVDTVPPRLVIEPDGRRGSVVAVRWNAKDEHLDLKSLVLEYQVDGARDWRQVPIRHLGLNGEERWDAGTATSLNVRASVRDKADNLTEALITLSEGTPANPGLASGDPSDLSSPAVSQISSGPSFPQDDPLPAASEPFSSPYAPPRDRASSAASRANSADMPAFVPEPDPLGEPGGGASTAAATEPAAGSMAPSRVTESAIGGGSVPTLLVSKPQFPLKYAVEDAGPGGPAAVELWVTQNGGQTWSPKGEDPDKVSPFPVDLGGEGTFGLRLVARSESGLGDPPPGPGDPPDIRVEVDSTPPTVQMLSPQVGKGQNLGKVNILWRASDLHLGPKAVVISWRADQAGAQWQPITPSPIENTQSFTWNVPPSVPPRFHLRVDVIDTAGNRGWAETTEGPPVIVDRTRPRSRIIGLDPSARTGSGASSRAVR